MGYTVNEDGTVTRDRVPNAENTSNSTNYSEGNRSTNDEENNSGCIIWILIIIVVGIIIGAVNTNNSVSDTDYDYVDSVAYDSVIDNSVVDEYNVDSAKYTHVSVSNQTEVIAPHKTKGGWFHSGIVITNYSQIGGGLETCRKKIDTNNACKNACILNAAQGVVVIGKNSFACEGISEEIKNVLEKYKSKGSPINDIVITPKGKYVIIEGNNGYTNNTGLPELEKELLRANKARETIYSVAISDNGNWAVITDTHYTSAGYFDIIKTARKKYGEVYSVSMANKGVVVCCKNGVYYENIPKNLSEHIDKLYWIPKYIKFTDGGTFVITDGKSAFWYNM